MWFEIACGFATPMLVYFFVSYIEHLIECRRFPPGPVPLPVIGNLHLLGKKPHEALAEFSKRYGSVFSISFGMRRMVVVSNIETAREALIEKTNVFAGRSKSDVADLSSRGYYDIVFADYGPLWRIMRKIGQSSLKMYEDHSGYFEKAVVKESEELHERLLKKIDKPMELHTDFNSAITNVICFIVFGERFQCSDPAFKEIILTMRNLVADYTKTSATRYLPWLRLSPFSGLKELKRTLSKLFSIQKEQLIKHYKADVNNVRDFTDSVIKLSRDKTMGITESEKLTDEHLENMLANMFIGGTETPLTSLLWFCLYLVSFPKYQEEIYNEIVSVVGENRYPYLNDRSSLELVKAFLNESWRFSSLLPLGIAHKTMSKTTLKGLDIPKDAVVMINHWQLHYDKEHWENPEEFNPYRWLNKDKKFDPDRMTSYLPFSTGTRGCLGRTVAEAELFIFFTRLVRDFKFEAKPGCPPPSLDGKFSVTFAPEPFEVLLTVRSNSLLMRKNKQE